MKKESPKHELKSLKDLLDFVRDYPEFMDEITTAMPKATALPGSNQSDFIQPIMPHIVRLKIWGMSDNSIRQLIDFEGPFYFDPRGFGKVLHTAIKKYARSVRYEIAEEVGKIIRESGGDDGHLTETYMDEAIHLFDKWRFPEDQGYENVTDYEFGEAILWAMRGFDPSLYFRRVTAQVLGRKMVKRLKLLYEIDFDSNETHPAEPAHKAA
ncbi:hypothetical protein GeomeDRAFT_3335 [Geobacter metallireducens RCH3]|uniref:Uncharacterized protein n=1 Tax=Geobacter metallireducens (strain ATCC 53774 / DSM 7210 / GS-15) TaxID=269799 RepID=Q39PP2_GEOMG|nr:hypothetical protein [Geobacter metallireducens]ABB33782.1 hypothetical protein Gmet_A3577 [Geobacter metallireducens GS-15]EHP83950.1 hypothetical protein GeomeDRAFT_3335 [Geobacter metallireducens RCH3]